MKEYQIELEIFEGNAGEFHTDGTYPDFARKGICAWMYGSYQVGQKFRYRMIWGNCAPGWWIV